MAPLDGPEDEGTPFAVEGEPRLMNPWHFTEEQVAEIDRRLFEEDAQRQAEWDALPWYVKLYRSIRMSW